MFSDIFTLIFIVFIVGFLGGIIYLIYLPIKQHLLKTGKLEKDKSNRINRIYILTLFLLCLFLFLNRNYRSSSESRIEKNTLIELPSEYSVITDNFESIDMDYSLFYEIKFSDNQYKKLIKSIEQSPFYNSKKKYINEGERSVWEDFEGVWYKTDTGYYFSKTKNHTTYDVEVNSKQKTLKYDEDLY